MKLHSAFYKQAERVHRRQNIFPVPAVDVRYTIWKLPSLVLCLSLHLKGLKIGIMGCIVTGPGEMADADYGYVGAGRGKISLYKKKECIEKNIPEEQAVEKLIELIKANGDYKENKLQSQAKNQYSVLSNVILQNRF